jgi:regulator of CtrA degradation
MQDQNTQMHETNPGTIYIAERIVTSDAFKALFREGMALVEDTAAYLDGPGRQESRALERNSALRYASESMRLTTRLMQLTSWLLLQRAVNEGELSREEADREHRKVRIAPAEASSGAGATPLPEYLTTLIERATGLQNRIMRLDDQLRLDPPPAPEKSPVAEQISALKLALGL